MSLLRGGVVCDMHFGVGCGGRGLAVRILHMGRIQQLSSMPQGAARGCACSVGVSAAWNEFAQGVGCLRCCGLGLHSVVEIWVAVLHAYAAGCRNCTAGWIIAKRWN
jgi:hypothetical protein